jgi:hypothetical protein
LAAVLALTHLLPGMILGGVLLAYFGTSTLGMGSGPVSDAEVGEFFGVFILAAIAGAVLISLSQALGYAAATWIITREALGEPAPVGGALRFGVRRMAGLWGWSLLYGLVAGFGLCLCVLPGIYFGFALALFGPVYLFERVNPFGRAWRMFHDNFGPVLGRLALLAAAVVAVQVVVSLFQNIGLAVSGGSTMESGADLAIALAFTLVGYVALLPATLLQASGLVVTYAEQRARQGPLTTAGLASELAYEPA